ncbi:MAG: M20/M25/M40 family metallo-hydrolase [Bacteroidota bacterium]
MKRKLLYALLLTAGSITSVSAQTDEQFLDRIREQGMYKSQVMATALQFTDVAGPRLANSPGLKRAQDWAVNELKTWGAVNAKREAWGKFGKGWEIQKNYVAITAPYYHNIIAVPKAWTPSTAGLVKGEVVIIKVDSLPDLEKYKGKLKGKIVMTEVKGTGGQTYRLDAARYTDSTLTAMGNAGPAIAGIRRGGQGGPGNRGAMAAAAAVRQALPKFYLSEGVALVLTQARGTDGTVFTSNGASYADTAKAVAPEIETSTEDYQRILRLTKAGVKVTLEADIKTEFFANDLQGYNVVGEIKGTDPKLKDELVIIGGHLDSWHAATGATDNAAGSAVMMEAMRILTRVGFKPRRTIRIVLWSSEEQGIHGSRNYVLNHFGDAKTMVLKPEQGKVSAYYNLDNGTGKIRGIYLQGNSAASDLFKSWFAPFKDLGATTVTISNTGGTDHLSFDAVGIPGFQFIQDPMDYNTRTHHTNQDTYDKLSEEDLKQASTIIASLVYRTSQRDEMIPRKPLPVAQPPRN